MIYRIMRSTRSASSKAPRVIRLGDHEIKDGDLIRFNRTTGHRAVEEVGVISLAPKPPSKALKFSH